MFLDYSKSHRTNTSMYTAEKQYWNRKKNIPRKEIARPYTNFYNHTVYLWAIYIFPRSVSQFGCSKIGGLILGIYKSLKDVWIWNLGTRPRSLISENTYSNSNLLCSVCRVQYCKPMYVPCKLFVYLMRRSRSWYGALCTKQPAQIGCTTCSTWPASLITRCPLFTYKIKKNLQEYLFLII